MMWQAQRPPLSTPIPTPTRHPVNSHLHIPPLTPFPHPSTPTSTLPPTPQPPYPPCSAGSYEDWRPDAADFPPASLGLPLQGWKGERWLDVRSAGVRAVMEARLQMCKDKGFPAADPDNGGAPEGWCHWAREECSSPIGHPTPRRRQRQPLKGPSRGLPPHSPPPTAAAHRCRAPLVAPSPPTLPVDGFANANGKGLTAADQLAFNSWLADAAHARGLAVGLKNDVAQIPQLAPKFDFFVNELSRAGEGKITMEWAAQGGAGRRTWSAAARAARGAEGRPRCGGA